MLTQTQRNAIFTGIATAYTINTVNFTALKTYRDHWDGVLTSPSTPVICLDFIRDGIQHTTSVGNTSKLDESNLAVDVYSLIYNNQVHGSTIVREITLLLTGWFCTTTSLDSVGVSVLHVAPADSLNELEDRIYRMRFVVKLLHEAI